MRIFRQIAVLTLAAAALSAVTLTNGLKTVTTAGTAVPLTASGTPAAWVTVQALSSNTGTVCVGGSGVVASTKSGTCLTAGQAAPLGPVEGGGYDLSTIYIDATVNGEGVSYTYAR